MGTKKPIPEWIVGKTTIELEYPIGMPIFLRTDTEQLQRIITGVIVRENGLMYIVVFADIESHHYGFELQTEENVLTRIK